MRFLILPAAVVAAFFAGCFVFQRKLLYFPSHLPGTQGLEAWQEGAAVLGCCRQVPSPNAVWLLLHGNAGQASDRAYALPSFSERDSVFILEYPGYGTRAGSPSLRSINAAAREAYKALRARFPSVPVCVAGESIGTGPACALAAEPRPPDKLVLIVPFDVLSSVASDHYRFLPARLLLRDNWNNSDALRGYGRPVEIFAGSEDRVIPIRHARSLAAGHPGTVLHEFPGGHNDWAEAGRVTIRY